MKIIVLNGSPKGDVNVTMQYFHFIHKKFTQHELKILDFSQRIEVSFRFFCLLLSQKYHLLTKSVYIIWNSIKYISKKLSILIALFLLGGCFAGTQIKLQPDPSVPVAEVPRYCLGDTYTSNGYSSTNILGKDTFTWTVENVNPDGSFQAIETSKGDGRRDQYVYNNQRQLVKWIDMKTGERKPVHDPPSKYLDFPLFVGKRWTDSYKGKSVSGAFFEYTNAYTVTEYTKIKVEAGEFEAFRIQKKQWNKVWSPSAKPAEEIYYYAPRAKVVIKSIPSWRIGHEIIDIHMTDCNY